MNMRKYTLLFLVLLVFMLGLYITRGLPWGQQQPASQEALTDSQASPLAQELYQLRNPYIGDASANGRILQALFPQDETGPYHMELETSEKPYVLHVMFREMPEDTAKMDALLSQQALLILALIDNADAVQLTYPLESGEEPVVSAVRVRREALYEALEVEDNEYELTPEILDHLISADSR